jgi:hypothetical protein
LNFKSHFKDFVINLKLNTNAMGVTVTVIALMPDLTIRTPQTFNAVYVINTNATGVTLTTIALVYQIFGTNEIIIVK